VSDLTSLNWLALNSFLSQNFEHVIVHTGQHYDCDSRDYWASYNKKAPPVHVKLWNHYEKGLTHARNYALNK
jgi:UDP-N-acetylglucosamine 2-epimerase